MSLAEATIRIVEWRVGAYNPGHPRCRGSAYRLTALEERLTPHNRFITMDIRGHRFSEKPPSGYALGTQGAGCPTVAVQ